jgi:NitT/TauT family transport system ATP-binding protein
MAVGGLAVRGLAKSYGSNNGAGRIPVFSDISFNVANGEILSIFGPNGCGKSTLLSVIAGLSDRDGGMVEINGVDSRQATIGFVFQDYHASLFPWWKTWENIALNLRIHGVRKAERRSAVEAFVQRVNVDLPLDNYTYNLSGGQQQLCVILRELIRLPSLLLLDEPFAALDYRNRMLLEEKLLELLSGAGIPVIIVTHDINDAIFLADNILILSPSPAHIRNRITVPFERPRPQAVRKSKLFFDIYNRALDISTGCPA